MTKKPSLTEIASAEARDIPRPPVRWFTRFGLPMAIVASAAIVLLVTGWNAFVPARGVTVISTAVRPVETMVRNQQMPSSAIQAPGWVEPDPFATYIPALEEGIIKELVALEGDHIMKGQVVARMVDDEARITVSQAQAELILTRSAFQAEKSRRECGETGAESAHQIQETHRDGTSRP